MNRIIVKLVDLLSVIDSTHIPCIISRKLKQTISVHTMSSLCWSLKYCEAHTPFRGKATTQTSTLFIYCHVEHSKEKLIVNFLFSFLGCNQPVQMLSLLVYFFFLRMQPTSSDVKSVSICCSRNWRSGIPENNLHVFSGNGSFQCLQRKFNVARGYCQRSWQWRDCQLPWRRNQKVKDLKREILSIIKGWILG